MLLAGCYDDPGQTRRVRAQVKNRASGRSRRLEKLADRAQRRVMLTGTPLQNDLQELYNLMQFLNPSTFRHQPQPEAAQVGCTT